MSQEHVQEHTYVTTIKRYYHGCSTQIENS